MNNIKKNEFWDYKTDRILPRKTFNEISKFHQSSTYIKRENKISYYPLEVFNWLSEVEYTDVTPNYYLSEINFNNVKKVNFKNSKRKFDMNSTLSKEKLGKILYNAFGRSKDSPSKRYPSAGALYPVLPLVYFFEDSLIEDTHIKPGCYFFDSSEVKLKCIKEWDYDEINNIKSIVNSYDGNVFTNMAISYAIDLKRAITKYRKRGYRHALIEVGLMAQSFREALHEEGLDECCWSGFDDNSLTYHSGLNVQLCPVVLVQWFGKSSEDS